MVTLLLLAANPIDSEQLRIDEELRDIQEHVSANPQIRVEVRLALRAQDLQKALLQLGPAMVHFTGHGENGEILLENPIGYPEPVALEALADLFRLFAGTVRCVVLNACDSSDQARLLSKFVDCSIGMEGPITVGAGKAFSVSFYQALAHGKDVGTAFELGRNQLLLENQGEEDVPRLYLREGIETLYPGGPTVSSSKPLFGIETLLGAQLSITASALGLVEHLTLIKTSYDEEPPPVVEKFSKRDKTLGGIQAELGGRQWYAVYGGIGSGKTHLAALMARRRTGRCFWLRLRDRRPAEALSIIEGTFTQIKPRPFGLTKAAWYEECCFALGQDSVIVLDDLPRTSGREEIDDCLIFLSGAVRKRGTLLITVGAAALPAPVRAAAGDRILEQPVPAFDEEEIRELLAAHGAPGRLLTDAWVTTVSVVCRQHPLLLTEAARFLEGKGWNTDAQAFQDVMTGQYAINLDAPTQHDLKRTVPDADTRELLYRLRLVVGPFTDADARGLASVARPLEHAAERLTDLLGLWVQRDRQDRYVVSPLVSRLKDSNLSTKTEKQVHSHLAARLVKERPMTAMSVMQAVHHSMGAGHHVNAGMLLLSALQAFLRAKKPKDDALLAAFWAHSPLPSEIPFAMRVCIRATQIAVYQQQGKDSFFLLTDLERLLASDKLPAELELLKIFIFGMLSTALWYSRPVDAAGYTIRGLEFLRTAPSKIAHLRRRRIRMMSFEMLWSTLAKTSNDSDLAKWLGQMDSLTRDEQLLWAKSKLADTGSEIACNEIWLREYRKPAEKRNWANVLGVLESTRDWAQARGVTVLYARAQWGAIVVLAEYLNRFEDAVALGERAIADCSSNARAVFWLTDIVGRQYHYKKRWKESLDWLMRCVNSSADVRSSTRAYATALAGLNAANLNADTAVELLSQAANIVASDPKEVPSVLAASIYAELAIERWRCGEKLEAFKPWSRAVELLLDVTNADDEWKIAITVVGNFSGYFAHVAQRGSDDTWTSAKPAAGRVLERDSSVLQWFDAGKLFAIPAQLTLLAEGLSLYDESIAWAARTSLADFTPELGSLIVRYRVTAHVTQGRFIQATEEAWNSYVSGVAELARAQIPHAEFSLQTGKIAVVTIAFGLARVRIREGVEAANRLNAEIGGRLRTLTQSGTDAFWTAAIEVLAEIAAGNQNWRILYETGMGFGRQDETALDVMYRLAAMMTSPPQEAFNSPCAASCEVSSRG